MNMPTLWVARELREQEERSRAALEYQARMQRTFEKCPGFVGCDAPAGPGRAGKVTVEPARLTEAVLWLKRRVRVSERLDLSADNAVCLEVASKNAPSTTGARPRKVTFGRPQQFELSL